MGQGSREEMSSGNFLTMHGGSGLEGISSHFMK